MTTDNDVLNAVDQALDERSLEWAAQWIEDSLKGEINERVVEFGKNMAMTLRAARLNAAPVVADGDDEGDNSWQERARKVLWDWKGLESLSISDLDELVGRIAAAFRTPVEGEK